ncbi:MAG TPA: aminotransferase class III-fold pyridoxal phosphate-dependent enzyme, partial [Spirochaetota bacterium]
MRRLKRTVCSVLRDMQGADGMIAQPPGYVRRMREICDRHGALLVCDEVATGFGRTGTMFAVEQEGVV